MTKETVCKECYAFIAVSGVDLFAGGKQYTC